MNIDQIFEAILDSALEDEAGDVRSILDELLPTPSKQDVVDIQEYCGNMGLSEKMNYSNDEGWYF